MADLKINTDSVVMSARVISGCNRTMRGSFSSVRSAINTLNQSWDGSAANNAIRKFNEMNANFSDARYNVLDNYVNFMLQQVGEGYETTETTNESLADAFK